MRTEVPKFIGRDGEGNYGSGWVGFEVRDYNIISQGILFFTSLEEYNTFVPKVSHSFYVVDEDTIIEAEAEGVIIADPKKYFNDPHVHVFFRKPINLCPAYVEQMTEFSFSLVGKNYDYGLFINFLWQWVCNKLHIPISKKQPPVLDGEDCYTCSEVTASALNLIPEYSKLFPLSEWHPSRISPQLLVSSIELFEPLLFDCI